MAGWSIYTPDGFNRYYPVRHAQGQNLPPNVVADWMADQLGTDIPKEVANGLYDMEAAWSEGVKDIKGQIRDIQICEPLLDADTMEGYSLEVLSNKYLGAGKEEEILKEAAKLYSHGGKRKGRGNIPFHHKKDLWLMDARYVGLYAEGDSIKTSLILKQQMRKIEDEGLQQIFDLESSLIPLLLRMRIKGIRVDMEGAHKLAKELTVQIDNFAVEIKKIVGFDLNVDSGNQLEKAYEEFNSKNTHKVQYRYTANGNKSFNKEWLSSQSDGLSKLIAKKRKLMTLRDDFVLGDILGEQVNGRIHAQFHQLRQDDKGTRGGRFSSTNPNLQQVPSREDPKAVKKELEELLGRDPSPAEVAANLWATRIRGLFLADEGEECLKADYSQQEPRLLTHFAALCKLPGVEEAVAKFRANPNTDYHQMITDLCNARSERVFSRPQIKGINLGIMYSMGAGKLAVMLGVSEETAKRILEDYHKAIPFVKGISQRAMTTAEERGFIRTLLGRKQRFDFWEPVPLSRDEPKTRMGLRREDAEKKWPNRRLRRWGIHKALNVLIQGSAADQTKKAMACMYYEHGRVPSIQVHDELVASVCHYEEAQLYKRVMENVVQLVIPVVSDAKLGPSWGYAKREVLLAA